MEPIVCMFCMSPFDMVNMVNLSAFIYRTLSAMRCLCFYCYTIEFFFPMFSIFFSTTIFVTVKCVQVCFFFIFGHGPARYTEFVFQNSFVLFIWYFSLLFFAFGKRLCLMTHIIIIEYGGWEDDDERREECLMNFKTI